MVPDASRPDERSESRHVAASGADMIARSDVAAIIVAGGKAQRAGGKIAPLTPVDGRVVIERQIAVLKPKVAEIQLSVSAHAPWSRIPTIVDDHHDIGPLAGIAAALRFAPRDYILCVGGDQAWLVPEALDLLIARTGDPFDACAVRLDYATPVPLFAIYHKRVAAKAAARIARGETSSAGLLADEGMAIRWIEDHELESVDPERASLRKLDVTAA
jgi:molybdopterin-guanine dinucleotide biosynthesis protein A